MKLKRWEHIFPLMGKICFSVISTTLQLCWTCISSIFNTDNILGALKSGTTFKLTQKPYLKALSQETEALLVYSYARLIELSGAYSKLGEYMITAIIIRENKAHPTIILTS